MATSASSTAAVVAPRRDGGADALLDDVARRREGCGWDLAVCLTDLPLHAQRVPLVAHCSARRRVGVVSLPALGLGQLRAGRTAVAGLVEGLLAADERSGRSIRDEQAARMVEDVAPIRRLVDDEQADITDVAYRYAHRLITEHRATLEEFARTLLAQEVLEREDIERVMGHRGVAPMKPAEPGPARIAAAEPPSTRPPATSTSTSHTATRASGHA